jgi:hypothetical protein
MTTPLKKGTVASRWLRAVQPLLSARLGGALKIATQLTEFLNDDVFAESGRLVGWQGIQGLAKATGLCERAVQANLRRLERRGVVVPTMSQGGRSKTNCYELKMPQTPHAGAGFNHQKPRTPVQGLAEQTPHSQVNKPRIRASKTPHAGAPELYKNYNRTLATTAETDPGAPRQRAGALGAPSEGEQDESSPRFGQFEADLRRALGERFKWLALSTLVEHINDTVVLSALTAGQADNIRKHCEADILAAIGASRLMFEIVLAAEPMNARRPP